MVGDHQQHVGADLAHQTVMERLALKRGALSGAGSGRDDEGPSVPRRPATRSGRGEERLMPLSFLACLSLWRRAVAGLPVRPRRSPAPSTCSAPSRHHASRSFAANGSQQACTSTPSAHPPTRPPRNRRRRTATRAPRRRQHRHRLRQVGRSAPRPTTELGAIITGAKVGRETDADITLFNSVGIGLQDVVTGRILLDRAREAGIGLQVDLAA